MQKTKQAKNITSKTQIVSTATAVERNGVNQVDEKLVVQKCWSVCVDDHLQQNIRLQPRQSSREVYILHAGTKWNPIFITFDYYTYL